ncbi:MAG: response regulator [Thermostichus sp. BF3_bins_97]
MVKRILGIHDGGDGWPLISASLKASGFDVGATDDLRMSLEMAVLCHPSLILLDLDLQDLAGWKILQQLKTNPSTASIPVVGLSEYPISLRDRAYAEGCVACEFKLEAPPILLDRLRPWLSPHPEHPEPLPAPAGIPDPEALTVPALPELKGLDQGTVLVVDDDPAARRILSRYLKSRGYKAIEASSGPEALGIIAHQPIDLVVLDIMMPQMNGLEVLHLLRLKHSTGRLPVIIASAMDDRDGIVGAFDLGANDYITKPIDFDIALARIQSQLAVAAQLGLLPSQTSKWLGGHYQIERPLSCGGFGCTYLVRDQHRPGRPLCVLKQLNPQPLSDESASSSWQALQSLAEARLGFEQEAEILERVGSHPQLPQLLAYFEQDQQSYLVQQFMPGSPLDKLRAQGSRWTAPQAIHFLRQMLPILSYLHQEGIIHRDLKPANILQAGDPEQATYNLVDFGAAVINGNHPTYSLFIGTEGYAPPEQYEGQPRPNSDLYALGQVALEMLTGQAPAPAGISPSPCQVYPLPPALWRILKKMTEADPHQRYAGCEEVLRDLDRLDLDPEDVENALQRA